MSHCLFKECHGEPVKREEVVISALPAGWEAFARKMVDEKAKGDWNAPCVICSRGANGEFPPSF